MQKWEYCILTGVQYVVQGARGGSFDLKPFYPSLIQLTASGPVKTELAGKDEALRVAQTIAYLGAQGWEMVNGAEQKDVGIMYFKRPIA